jgi:hypothetical protein
MAIFRSIPSKRIINGHEVETSESAIVTNESYTTNGEYALIIKGVENCTIYLDSTTTDHIVIKSLTNVLVKSNKLIDEEFNEVELTKGSCVEFMFIGSFWYILSSDGLKDD